MWGEEHRWQVSSSCERSPSWWRCQYWRRLRQSWWRPQGSWRTSRKLWQRCSLMLGWSPSSFATSGPDPKKCNIGWFYQLALPIYSWLKRNKVWSQRCFPWFDFFKWKLWLAADRFPFWCWKWGTLVKRSLDLWERVNKHDDPAVFVQEHLPEDYYTNPPSRVAHLKPVRNDVRSCVAELLGGDGGLLKQETIRSECYVFGFTLGNREVWGQSTQ